MPIDPFAISTIGFAAFSAFAFAKSRANARLAENHAFKRARAEDVASHYRGRVLDHEAELADAKRRRTEQARKAGIAGGEKRKAKAAAEAPARRAQTVTELASTKFRTRAQVVAPVKAARTRKQNSGAGAAAKQGG